MYALPPSPFFTDRAAPGFGSMSPVFQRSQNGRLSPFPWYAPWQFDVSVRSQEEQRWVAAPPHTENLVPRGTPTHFR